MSRLSYESHNHTSYAELRFVPIYWGQATHAAVHPSDKEYGQKVETGHSDTSRTPSTSRVTDTPRLSGLQPQVDMVGKRAFAES